MLKYRGKEHSLSSWKQLAYLLVMVGVLIMIVNICTFIFIKLYVPQAFGLNQSAMMMEYGYIFKWLNVGDSILILFVPPFLLAWIQDRQPIRRIGLYNHFNGKHFFLIVCLTPFLMLSTGIFTQITQAIPIPHMWYKKALQLEMDYNKTVIAIMQMKGIGDLFISITIVALLPAIVEEVFFRGTLQPILTNIFKSAWGGIIITAFIFSIIHDSYFGLLARWEMGIILGAVFYYSRCIWLNILLHFFNNAYAVLILYGMQRKGYSAQQILNQMNNNIFPYWLGLIGIVGAVLLLWRLKILYTKKIPS